MNGADPGNAWERSLWAISSRGLDVLGESQWVELTADSKVLEAAPSGNVVLRRPDGSVVKTFRHRRALSSALWRPYAVRFVANARALASRGVPSLEIEGIWNDRSRRRHVVHYHWLEGSTLAEALRANHDPAGRHALIERLAEFVGTLHERGVFFRSLHFANVVVQPDGSFGLIDVADISFSSRPLGLRMRVRNFEHLWRYREDVAVLEAFGLEGFVAAYTAGLPAANWDSAHRSALERALLDRLGRLGSRGQSRSRPLKSRAAG